MNEFYFSVMDFDIIDIIIKPIITKK
jgi:hypothetical protein